MTYSCGVPIASLGGFGKSYHSGFFIADVVVYVVDVNVGVFV